MKRKIILSMSVIALLSIVVSMVLSGVVSYYDSLKIIQYAAVTESEYIVQGLSAAGDAYLENIHTLDYGTSNQSVRVTLIGEDGTVLFDSVVDVQGMENHNDRPEVQMARETGKAESIRRSDTVNVQSYNYAVLLPENRVLRLSVGMRSVFGSIERMVPWMLLCSGIVLLLAVLLSTYRTRQIVQPINAIDLDRPLQNAVYEELSPLLRRIERQNGTIQEKMEELRRAQAEFTAITENMQEGFLVVDAEGRVLSFNASAVRLLGMPPQTAHDRIHVRDFRAIPRFRESVETALAGRAAECILQIGIRSYSLIANPVHDAGGVRGAVLVLLDVTEKEERERLRREFTANVSHELKTPLTSISGYAEIMQNGLVRDEDVPRFAGKIYTEAQRLINLVEDILRISRLEDAPDEPERRKNDLLQMAKDVAERLQIPAAKAQVDLTVQGEPTEVQGVTQILDEMLFNLMDNAVKYNRPGGTVTVTVGCTEGRAGVKVQDTGIGIPETDMDRVFERFYRVDKSRSKQIGGTGLGLSIVKHGAALHDAQVFLESRVGEGTTVRLLF